MIVKLLKTIKNGMGDIFRKNSVVMAEKKYGGYELRKLRKRKNGCIVAVTRVPDSDFSIMLDSTARPLNQPKQEARKK